MMKKVILIYYVSNTKLTLIFSFADVSKNVKPKFKYRNNNIIEIFYFNWSYINKKTYLILRQALYLAPTGQLSRLSYHIYFQSI
jgi:hypothetical protein